MVAVSSDMFNTKFDSDRSATDNSSTSIWIQN